MWGVFSGMYAPPNTILANTTILPKFDQLIPHHLELHAALGHTSSSSSLLLSSFSLHLFMYTLSPSILFLQYLREYYNNYTMSNSGQKTLYTWLGFAIYLSALQQSTVVTQTTVSK